MECAMQQSHADDSQGFSAEEKRGLYRAIYERRDVRSQFLPDAIPQALLSHC